mgnify:CR=1 FL=1
MDRRSFGLILVTAGLMLTLAGCGLKAARLVSSIGSLQQRLQALETVLRTAQDVPLSGRVVLNGLLGLRQDLEDLKSEIAPWLAAGRYLGWVPGVGGDLQAAPQLLSAISAVTEGAASLALAVAPASSADVGAPDALAGNSGDTFEWRQLSAAGPGLMAARSQFARAANIRSQIDPEELSSRAAALIERIDRYLPLLRAATDGALLAARMADGTTARRHLILLQNNDELRATGGFISGVVALTIAQEGVIDLSVMDSYQVDDLTRSYPPPPDPLRDFMAADLWLFRDANWSPDFPTAAQTAAALFSWGQHDQEVDGVIAIDQHAARLILEAVGPITIPGQDEPLSADNLVAFMYQAWSPQTGQSATQDWWEHRKDFMKDLAGAITARLQEPAELDLAHVFLELHRALLERHLLIYMREPLAAQILAENAWDGALRVGNGDYLMVVDTNVGYNKVNPNIQQAITYRVDLTDAARPAAEVTVSYRNDGLPRETSCRQAPRYGDTYEDLMHRCYWDFLRVLTPRGSQLLAGTSAPLPEGSLLRTFRGRQETFDTLAVAPEDGLTTTFVSFFVLAPGERGSRQLSYLLPPEIVIREETRNVYRLMAQKQPGTLAIPLRIEVALPSDSAVILSQPTSAHSEGNVLIYELALQTDQYLELVYR